jgi:hypothetical protein
MFEYKPIITKELVLKHITEEEIFEKYLNVPVQCDYHFCSTLRDDPNPTCTFKYINNKLYYRDWIEEKGKDAFDIVQYFYKLQFGKTISFQEALEAVAVAFNLVEGETPEVVINRRLVVKEKTPVNLQIARQPFTSHCIKYWTEQGISMPTLLKFNVASVKAVWIRGKQVYSWNKNDLAFAYMFSEDIFKIYFPNRHKKQIKFFNCEIPVLEGYLKLPETGDFALITKSYKDVMALHEYGIPAVAPPSEVVPISPLAVAVLKDRFNNLFSLMDNDMTGKRMALKLRKEYNVTPLLFQKGEPKDFTDNRRLYGNHYMLDMIQHMKDMYAIEENYNSRNTA